MYKMAVVGDYDRIYGFAALGLDTFPADGLEKLEQVFHSLVSGGYAVIYMTEAAAAQISLWRLILKKLVLMVIKFILLKIIAV